MEEEFGRFFLSNYRTAPLHFGEEELAEQEWQGVSLEAVGGNRLSLVGFVHPGRKYVIVSAITTAHE